MDYKILKNKNTEKLEEQVKEYLDNGWDFHGVTTVVPETNNHYLFYSQTMIKKDPNKQTDKTSVTIIK